MSTAGLVLFALMLAIAFPAILIDAGIALAGGKTITQWSTEKGWREWSLIAGVLLGALGFAVHLLTFGG